MMNKTQFKRSNMSIVQLQFPVNHKVEKKSQRWRNSLEWRRCFSWFLLAYKLQLDIYIIETLGGLW